ncbi:MAG: hypothetical protein KF796_17525 [Ramlibacter sp.]|nr:hypothetical protein [Ramlibacter sp.]
MLPFSECEQFQAEIEPGKGGIEAKHRPRLMDTRRARCLRSLNFEACISGLYPDHKRWDYFIEASTQPNVSHAVEFHQYVESDLRAKKKDTLRILEQCCPGEAGTIRTWIVAIEGRMPRADISARFSAQTGIRVVGRQLKIEDI